MSRGLPSLQTVIVGENNQIMTRNLFFLFSVKYKEE